MWYPVQTTRTKETLLKLQDFMDRYGVPRQMVTDRGTCFTSDECEQFCNNVDVRHSLISSRWPQSIGQVERVMRTIVPTIMSTMENEEQWNRNLVKVQRNLNTHVNETTHKTPFEVLYGYLPTFEDGRLNFTVYEKDPEWKPPQELRQKVQKRMVEQQAKYKKRYDKKRFKGVKYQVGDIVAMKTVPTATGDSTKLQPKYKGPMEVINVLPNDTYRVSTITDGGRHHVTTANVAQLKIYRNCFDTDSEDEAQSDECDEAVDEHTENPTLSVSNDDQISLQEGEAERDVNKQTDQPRTRSGTVVTKPKYLKDFTD